MLFRGNFKKRKMLLCILHFIIWDSFFVLKLTGLRSIMVTILIKKKKGEKWDLHNRMFMLYPTEVFPSKPQILPRPSLNTSRFPVTWKDKKNSSNALWQQVFSGEPWAMFCPPGSKFKLLMLINYEAKKTLSLPSLVHCYLQKLLLHYTCILAT